MEESPETNKPVNGDVEMKVFKSNIPETVANSIYDRICELN